MAKKKAVSKTAAKNAKKAVEEVTPALSLIKPRIKEVLMLVLAAISAFLFIAMASYHPTDPSWSHTGQLPIQNWAGLWGAMTSGFLLSVSGFFGYAIPALVALAVWVLYREPKDKMRYSVFVLQILGAAIVFTSGSGLSTALFGAHDHLMPQGAGGIVGTLTYHALLPEVSRAGALIILIAGLLIGLTLFSGLRWLEILGALLNGLKYLLVASFSMISAAKEKWSEGKEVRQMAKIQKQQEKAAKRAIDLAEKEANAEPVIIRREPEITNIDVDKPIEPKIAKQKISRVKPEKSTGHPETDSPETTSASISKPTKAFKGKVPSVDLLDNPETNIVHVDEKALQHMAQLVEEKLTDFGVTAKVVGVCPGPVVTRYELQPAPGMKVSKISGLAKDLARSLSAISVRVVEVIPGKSVIGIEIPNEKRQMVRLKEVLATKDFMNAKSPLMMGLGKDISGDAESVDLQKMPHLLVAGTTGSGKSVGLNAMLLSILLKATPDQVRMIMIDPKMLELSIYEGIPHLLTPVVTDMKEAANSLRWCVKEMDRRYRLMAALGVRNLAGYNDKVAAAIKAKKPIDDPIFKQLNPHTTEVPTLEPLPCIMVLVDEFADMMMVVGKKVEELIARLAQKARAAGIHLILATQRPSVDVITGLIKANIPTRIAFQVSSKIDSRTILDQQGAEQLLGHGDMLYLPPGAGVPTRVHGAFVADHEVHKVVEAWKSLGEPEYVESILQTTSSDDAALGESGSDDPEQDELYDQAVKLVIESGRASISMVQRRLKIGYNRSARLLEAMEMAGLVSEVQSNGMREVLVSRQE